jgi:hypothetical protein
MKEATCSSIPEDGKPHNHCCEKLKSYTGFSLKIFWKSCKDNFKSDFRKMRCED